MRVIGAADEFWRLRMSRVDTTDDLDFEWHEDILYREPAVKPTREVEQWNVEAVKVTNQDAVVIVASFSEREEADAFFDTAREHLAEMTQSQFEDAYFRAGPDDSVEASDPV